MSDEQLEAYVKQLLGSHRTQRVSVSWQGGEPTLMGLDFFRRSVELVEQHRKPFQVIEYTIQTNGTLLDDAWAAFFKEHGFLVGLSVDGPRALHDVHRVNKSGKGDVRSRDARLGGAEGARRRRQRAVHGTLGQRRPSTGRISVLPRRDGRAVPAVHPRRGAGHRATGLPRTETIVTDRSVGGEQLGRFLIAIFDEWLQADVGEVFIQHFDSALANWFGEPAGVCVFAETCGLGLALEHNGDLYSCDHFVEPDHLLGNINEEPMIELVASAAEGFRGGQTRRSARRTAATAMCASPATAAAPRTDSGHRQTARKDSTTCARATRPSSGTLTV